VSANVRVWACWSAAVEIPERRDDNGTTNQCAAPWRGGTRRNSFSFLAPVRGAVWKDLPGASSGGVWRWREQHVRQSQPTCECDGVDRCGEGRADAEESGIPAAYTYLGQFIDHDLTFDPASSLQKQNDPDALVDYRTPRFDLDSVYGRGPDDQPYLYADNRSFLLGLPLSGAEGSSADGTHSADGDLWANPNARDLVRNRPLPAEGQLDTDRARAIIGDPRNDENVIVSQLQGMWHRFHNRLAKDHETDTETAKSWRFAHVQGEVRFYYQWMLLHDFLPKIVSGDVLDEILRPSAGGFTVEKKDLKFFHPRDEAFMPLEFSAAAYRFGHSMVRPGYKLNHGTDVLPLFNVTTNVDMRGFQRPRPTWALDWRRFIDLKPMDYGFMDPAKKDDPKNRNRLQMAYKIDTSLTLPLMALPDTVAKDPSILGLRNLERGWRMRLPNGQDVARAMGEVPLSDADILIGKFTGADGDEPVSISTIGGGIFNGNCPLWTYILAETFHHQATMEVECVGETKQLLTPQLGPVGGRIVAETFVGLMLADSSSYLSLDPLWTPKAPVAQVEGQFGLRDMIAYALGG